MADRTDGGAEGDDTATSMPSRPDDRSAVPPSAVLHGEQLRVDTEDRSAGTVRITKAVDVDHVGEAVDRALEAADDLERIAVPDPAHDSGQVETLADGSVSVPVFEEQLVISKRLIVRERVVVRKTTRTVTETVEADLRTEHARIETDAPEDVVAVRNLPRADRG